VSVDVFGTAPGDGDPDDIASSGGTAREESALDFLRKTIESQRQASTRTVTLRPVQRPEFELVCEVPADMSVVSALTKQAETAAEAPSAPAEGVIANCKMLARFTRILRVRGQDVPGSGEGSVFASKQLLSAVGAPNAWRAVRETFVRDGGYDDVTIGHLANELMTASGLKSTSAVSVGQDPT